MASVRVYTTRICAYCFAAKRLLGARGIAYDEVDVTGDAEARTRLVSTTGRKIVPQIFIGPRTSIERDTPVTAKLAEVQRRQRV